MFVAKAKRWLLPERTRAEYTPRQRDLAASYVTAAMRRIRLARDLSPEAPVVPAALLRDAIALLVRAAIAASDADADGPTLVRLNSTAALAELRAAAKPNATDDDRRIDEAISSRDPLYFDSLEPAELSRTYAALVREAEWLRAGIDLRSSTNIKATRIGRVAAVSLFFVYLGYCGITRAFPAHNLALGKSVRLSTQEGGTPDPSGLVDGKTGGTYGAHTQVATRPGWAVIDLGSDANLKKVVVYNRGDLNLNDGLPYAIDLSNDGSNFREVARRDTPFGDGSFLSPPWSAPVRDRARYVRIRATWYLALSEVQVF